MYICKVCNQEFACLKQLGGHTSKHRKSKQQLIYEDNPKLCKECDQQISWKSRPNRIESEFCCVSCRAKFFYKKTQMIEENVASQTKY
jgi:DNA-directed RNA polymerase subunit RPC12/RpoP